MSDGRPSNGHHVGPLSAPPRFVATLAVNSRRVLCCLSVTFIALACVCFSTFWPILVEEDFQAYLRCDGEQHTSYEALNVAREITKAARKGGRRRLEMAPERELSVNERSVMRFTIKVIYTSRDGGNIFTEKRLAQIRNIERRIENELPSYKRLCYQPGDQCVPPLSVINFFYASRDTTGDLTPDGKGTHILPIQAMLANLGTTNAWFLDRYFGVTASHLQQELQANITRSVFRFGIPLRGFTDPQDRPDEQSEVFRKFITEEFYPLISTASTEDVLAYYYGDFLSAYEVTATVWHDALYAIGSLIFVLGYLVFHLRSVILAFSAMGCIALSFPLSYGIYCLCWGHHKMIAINFLSLFVVLGVGADDVFVLNDVWRNSASHGTGEMALARRLWQMYRKAGAAIFATSATTAASFFANLASSIGPLRQFGFFMGICISMNWVVVASTYPFILVVLERRRGGGVGSVLTMQNGDTEMEEQLVGGDEDEMLSQDKDDPLLFTGGGSHQEGRPSKISMGLWKGLTSFGCLAGFLVPAAAFAGAVVELRPATGLPQFFPKESNLGALQYLQRRFGNETMVSNQELRLCGGMVRPVAQCDAIQPPPPPSPPPKIPGSILHAPVPSPSHPPALPTPAPPHILHTKVASRPPGHPWLPHFPHPAIPPFMHPVTTKAPMLWTTVTATFAPSTVPLTTPPPDHNANFQVDIEVNGHSKDEVEQMRPMFQAMLMNKFGLPFGAVSIDVTEEDDGEPRTGEVSVRRLGKRKVEVVLRFRDLTKEQEAAVLEYVRTHRAELSKLGAHEVSPSNSGMSSPKDHNYPAPTPAPKHHPSHPSPSPSPWWWWNAPTRSTHATTAPFVTARTISTTRPLPAQATTALTPASAQLATTTSAHKLQPTQPSAPITKPTVLTKAPTPMPTPAPITHTTPMPRIAPTLRATPIPTHVPIALWRHTPAPTPPATTPALEQKSKSTPMPAFAPATRLMTTPRPTLVFSTRAAQHNTQAPHSVPLSPASHRQHGHSQQSTYTATVASTHLFLTTTPSTQQRHQYSTAHNIVPTPLTRPPATLPRTIALTSRQIQHRRTTRLMTTLKTSTAPVLPHTSTTAHKASWIPPASDKVTPRSSAPRVLTTFTTMVSSTTIVAKATTPTAAKAHLPVHPPAPSPPSVPWRPPPAPPSVPWRPPPAPPPTPPPPGPTPPPHPMITLPSMHKRGMAYDRMSNIDIFWGVKPGSRSKRPEMLFNPDFDLRKFSAQQALVDFCDRALATPRLKIFKVDCWPQLYRDYFRSNGEDYPNNRFEVELRPFYDRTNIARDHIGWSEDDIVVWVSITFRVQFDSHSGGHQISPYMATWKEFVDEENQRVTDKNPDIGRDLGPAMISAELFVRAEAEERVINSALSSFLVSVGCALAAVAVFTRNVFLTCTATFAIFATAACSLYTITSIFHWDFGLMEAVSLIIFCGFSVDYPLHVVQAYVMERSAGAGVREALREVGFAVASGCFTTVGAAAFLLMCQITIFRRFGQVLIANMLFALLFALLWIPALLEWREMTPCRTRHKVDTSSSASRHAGLSLGSFASSSDGRGSFVPPINLATQQITVESPPEGFEALGGATPR